MFSFLSRLTLYECIVNVVIQGKFFNSRKDYYRQGQYRIGVRG